MFTVILFTTIFRPAAPGKPSEIASVSTTTIPGFETRDLAIAAANLLDKGDQPGIDRRAVVVQTGFSKK